MLDELIELIQQKRNLPTEQQKWQGLPIYGRIGSTFSKDHMLTHLSEIPGRKGVFVFGPESVPFLFSKSPYEFLLHLGFMPEYIHREVVIQKYPQKLILFIQKDEKPLVVPATWDGVLNFIKIYYPASLNEVKKHLNYMKNHSISEIEKEANLGHTFFELTKGKHRNPFYLSYKKYCNLPEPKLPWHTRFFLYCELRLLDLFDGKGYTIREDGVVCAKEYLCENFTIKALQDQCRVLDFDVVVPEEVKKKFGVNKFSINSL